MSILPLAGFVSLNAFKTVAIWGEVCICVCLGKAWQGGWREDRWSERPGRKKRIKRLKKSVRLHLHIVKSCICVSKKKLRGSLLKSLSLKKNTPKIQNNDNKNRPYGSIKGWNHGEFSPTFALWLPQPFQSDLVPDLRFWSVKGKHFSSILLTSSNLADKWYSALMPQGCYWNN